MAILDASRTIHSMYAKVLMDGVEQTNVSECTAKITLDKKEINVVGDDWTRYKRGTKKGAGTFKGFHVTSDMIKRDFKRFELIAALEDPEAYGFERIRLKNCMADEVNLIDLKVGDLVTEESNFTFEGYDLLDAIEA
ncbi:phage tail tube protein [Clostridium beijerinckii]|uniref:phage tail tube protein n=1 Tax=Clostridium beijerinckii TaxID=1520 RepID=UPI0003D2E875|nr:phage tail tube protein [Clostridium beijerinckii]ALB46213.1 phage portal protein [Clostridium beijerinckii NRRL B-598]